MFWWAFQWARAHAQARPDESGHALAEEPPKPHPDCDPQNGVVVLIDEIDKAESDLPNGLLEVLGANQFTPEFFDQPVKAKAEQPPLVVITTNNERELPSAFLRRCVVHEIQLPDSGAALKAHLIKRGKAHFPDADPEVFQQAAKLLEEDRQAALSEQLRPVPGQAEYIDLLRAVLTTDNLTATEQIELLERLSRFFLKKHPADAK